jgi:hypothetical protein
MDSSARLADVRGLSGFPPADALPRDYFRHLGIIRYTKQLRVHYLQFFAALFEVAEEILREFDYQASIAAYWREYLQQGRNREIFFHRAITRQVGI